MLPDRKRRRCAVIGDPVNHSLSPAIHSAGYALHGLDWEFGAVNVAKSELAGFVTACMADPATWAGLAVTAPHKEAIIGFGDLDEEAQLVGGGNTLRFGERPLVRNTDVPGFVIALRERGIRGLRSVAVIGAGATARSILVAAAELGAREVQLLVRSVSRAQTAVALAEHLGMEVVVRALDDELEPTELLASTIPAAATSEHAVRLVRSGQAVFDVVYDPWPTPLWAAACQVGTPVLSGLDLLAGQAVEQFRCLSGYSVTFAGCRSAAERELRRRRGV